MNFHRITPAAILGVAVSGLLACRSDSVSAPDTQQLVSAHRQSGGGGSLVVDDDRKDCRRADYTTIQAAVDAAEPGSQILVCAGTYHEQVLIRKNGLRLFAKGKPGRVVLDGRDEHAMLAGFLLENAHGNLIEGFLVRRYHEAGIWLRPLADQPTTGSSRNTIRRNVTTGAGHDGIQLLASNDNVIEHNVVVDHLAPNGCGVNVFAGSARNVVRHNRLVNNEWGIQIAGGTTLDNVISENKAFGNRGNGIRNIGASGTTIEENRAFGNGFAPSILTDPDDAANTAAGIRIASGSGIVVRDNRAARNLLVDLLKEAAAAATFEDNDCKTSSPLGLCERHKDDDERDEDDEGESE